MRRAPRGPSFPSPPAALPTLHIPHVSRHVFPDLQPVCLAPLRTSALNLAPATASGVSNHAKASDGFSEDDRTSRFSARYSSNAPIRQPPMVSSPICTSRSDRKHNPLNPRSRNELRKVSSEQRGLVARSGQSQGRARSLINRDERECRSPVSRLINFQKTFRSLSRNQSARARSGPRVFRGP